ncbi:hypothetical protein [uncultured Microbacterium sp.]|uniref:hypothetical protein n=1 Tax=uncultured Microbacterium sp. TaxID=191216 RepID=UPI0025F436B7|nr:hypothetical protein [uncultured Microbacterium sp.]
MTTEPNPVVTPAGDTSPASLHPIVRTILLAAANEAATARGPGRREAFRTSRYLLAACRVLEQPRADIAALLGVRGAAVTARSAVEGAIPAETFARLAGIEVDEIDAWRSAGVLPDPVAEFPGRISYPATALLDALLSTRWAA